MDQGLNSSGSATSPPYPAQATSSPVDFHPLKGIDLHGPQQEVSCSRIYTQMLDNVSLEFVIYMGSFLFSCGTLLQYLVYLVLIVINFLD
jgi:hypothetical protein